MTPRRRQSSASRAPALIDLKLSQSAQFRDEAGGCALVKEAPKQGNAAAAKRWPQCGAAL
jgi:hypothetical protein